MKGKGFKRIMFMLRDLSCGSFVHFSRAKFGGDCGDCGTLGKGEEYS